MEAYHARREKFYIRLSIGILVGLVLFSLMCWGGCHLYRDWEEKRLLRRAAAFMSGGDLKEATLTARRAFQINPYSLDAARLIAKMAESANDRTALEWRKTALELAPGSVEDASALITTALLFGETATAERALAAIPPEHRDTASYHASAARVAEAHRKMEEAEPHWARAVELAPADSLYRLKHALSQLASRDPARQEKARASLTALRADPAHRVPATRALITDAVTRRETAHVAFELARELQAYPEATFGDRLVYLDILRQLKAPEYVGYLSKMEADALAQPRDLAELLGWMNRSGLSALAVDFARSVPPEKLKEWPVPLVLADSHALGRDWKAVEELVRNARWGQFDFLRKAMLARALRGQDKMAAATREWADAQKLASEQPQFLQLLTRTISDWNWKEETLDLLWQLTKHPETRAEALATLYAYYAEARDTQGLYRTLRILVEVNPDDPKIKNNFAQVALLLDAEPERARALSRQLYQTHGADPAYASTYAFSVYRSSGPEQALAIMEKLPAEALQDPGIAAYHALFLAAAGRKEEARPFIERAAAARLLPEERALLTRVAGTPAE